MLPRIGLPVKNRLPEMEGGSFAPNYLITGCHHRSELIPACTFDGYRRSWSYEAPSTGLNLYPRVPSTGIEDHGLMMRRVPVYTYNRNSDKDEFAVVRVVI